MTQTRSSLLTRLPTTPGDADAWRDFDELYRPLLTSWLLRHALQTQDVEEVLQDVLAAVVSEMPRFQYDPEKGRFRAWLRTILVNRLRMFWRQRKARPKAIGDSDFQL